MRVLVLKAGMREDSGAPGTASAHVHQEGLSGKGCHWETITTSVRDAAGLRVVTLFVRRRLSS